MDCVQFDTFVSPWRNYFRVRAPFTKGRHSRQTKGEAEDKRRRTFTKDISR